jgi:uncharacterized membrane protein
MATDVQEAVLKVLNRLGEDVATRLRAGTGDKSGGPLFANRSGKSSLSGMRGIAAGAAAAAIAPLLAKGVGKLGETWGDDGVGDVAKAPVEKLGNTVGGAIGSKLTDKVDEAGGPSGILKDAAKSALPFGGGGGGDDDDEGNVPGIGKGRRMPVQQSVDVGAPIEMVYNQWTQFELWPNLMHRVTRVTQEDDCTVSFETKIWGKTKEFTARIETQRPNQRIKWRVTEGMTHTGVVTFHELGPQLTRVLVGLDVDPGGMLEKAARGMRHIKRAVRGDLHRFKAFVEMHDQETGAWRGVIENGELVKKHSASYDKRHQYSELDEVFPDSDRNGSSSRRDASKRKSGGSSRSGGGSGRRSQASRSGGGSSRSSSSRGGSSRSSGSRGGSSGSSGSRGGSSGSSGSRGGSSGSSGSRGGSSGSSGSRGGSSGRTRSASRSRSSQRSRNHAGERGSRSTKRR